MLFLKYGIHRNGADMNSILDLDQLPKNDNRVSIDSFKKNEHQEMAHR